MEGKYTNIVHIAQIVGTVSIFLLFCIKFYIAINDRLFIQAGRPAILWATVYIFFLFILRSLSLFSIGTQDQLRIVSGFSALVPLIAVLIHIYLGKKIDQNTVVPKI